VLLFPKLVFDLNGDQKKVNTALGPYLKESWLSWFWHNGRTMIRLYSFLAKTTDRYQEGSIIILPRVLQASPEGWSSSTRGTLKYFNETVASGNRFCVMCVNFIRIKVR